MCAIKNGHEFCRYKLSDGLKSNGVMFASLHRGPMGNWLLNATGNPLRGRTADSAECLSDCSITGKSIHEGKGEVIGGDNPGDGCCVVS